jgi:hypothetical protein
LFGSREATKWRIESRGETCARVVGDSSIKTTIRGRHQRSMDRWIGGLVDTTYTLSLSHLDLVSTVSTPFDPSPSFSTLPYPDPAARNHAQGPRDPPSLRDQQRNLSTPKPLTLRSALWLSERDEEISNVYNSQGSIPNVDYASSYLSGVRTSFRSPPSDRSLARTCP